MAAFVVGFDLDLTLVDPRPGVVAAYQALTAETGVEIDAHAVAARIGPQLEIELANWFPAHLVDSTADRYREIFAGVGLEGTTALPGAADALAAVRRHGGRSVVITAKSEPLAAATLARLGLEPDELIAWRWAAGKTAAMRECGVGIYVGDHSGDMTAAVAAGVRPVGVATGGTPRAALREAGADVVLDSIADFPAWLTAELLPGRLRALDDELRQLGSVLVAFSGGADSAFVLAAAARALGADNVIAATAVSASLPAVELDAAREFAAALGLRHLTPATDEMARPGYLANSKDRCYFCKAELLDVLTPLATRAGARHVVTGTNADDAVAGFRPGIKAADERGARAPLRDAGLTKDQVRLASRDWGLSTWDKPAAACLSSRIAYGIEVTSQRLARVERAELSLRRALADAGHDVRDLRVRDLGDRARVEVDAHLVPALAAQPQLWASIDGFDAVELDPRGFRSGSMNEALRSQPTTSRN